MLRLDCPVHREFTFMGRWNVAQDLYGVNNKCFASALHNSLCNEVLKKGYNSEFSITEQHEPVCMVKEAFHYNHRMQCIDSANMAVSMMKLVMPRPQHSGTQTRAGQERENVVESALGIST